jgi:hypothetical protein
VAGENRTVRISYIDSGTLRFLATPPLYNIHDDGEDVLRILRKEVASAWERFDRIAQTFHKVVTDPSSLPPYPDGIVYLRHLAHECRGARDQFLQALQREVEFVTQGGVPDTKE